MYVRFHLTKQQQCLEGQIRGTPSTARRVNQQGFHLTHEPRETEERQREQENNDVKVQRFPCTWIPCY